ncbi:MAG: hypothetical protein PHU14_15895 [Methylovulum sp.]|nr:hypothetical protein [Methylovulum sp.]
MANKICLFTDRHQPSLLLGVALLTCAFNADAKITIVPPFTVVSSSLVNHTQDWVNSCEAAYKIQLQNQFPTTWQKIFDKNKAKKCTEYAVTYKASIYNDSNQPALDVTGTTATLSSNITVTQASAAFGSMTAHSYATVESAFQIIANGFVDTSNPRVHMKLGFHKNPLYSGKNFPVNTWVKVSSIKTTWSRSYHASMVVNKQTGHLITYGSETHGSYDNSVREFDTDLLSWTTHYPATTFDTYQLDAKGQAISGSLADPKPWAMHTYDEVVYDPMTNGLVVDAIDPHNWYAFGEFPNAIHPTWLYDLNNKSWRTFVNYGSADTTTVPHLFASSSEYDSIRNIIWALIPSDSNDRQGQLWYMNSKRDAWVKVPNPAGGVPLAQIQINTTMVQDSLRDKLVVFGQYARQNGSIAVYSPNQDMAAAGSWEVKLPGGDPVIPDDQIPVDYDRKQGVFVLLPSQSGGEDPADTFVYDPDKNSYIKVPNASQIPNADLNPLNYMLRYSPKMNMFFLITGRWFTTTAVWAFKLDYSKL